MRLCHIIKPVLVIAGAAFLFVLAGCGRQGVTTPGKATVVPSKMTQPEAKSAAKDDKPYKPDEPGRPTLEVSQQGITLNWVEKGVLRMSATASHLDGKELFSTGWLKNFSGKMYEDGKLTGTMTAPDVMVDMKPRVVTATGGVKVKLVEHNAVITSKWMKWYSKQQKIIGGGEVKITSDMGTSTSAAFVADTALKNLKLLDSSKGLDIE